MSHFPGTDRYSKPDTEFDRTLMESLRQGRLQTLAKLDERTLDQSGKIELRCWAAAGMLGDRVPDLLEFNPSWHHNYCSVGFWQPPAPSPAPHYPPTNPQLVPLTRVLRALAYDAAARQRYRRDAAAFASEMSIPAEHATLLESASFEKIAALGVHPLLPFLARVQLDREN